MHCAVEMLGIVKRFPGVVANDHIDFRVLPGEVHALLGENGAGKSTLMQILAGLYRPDAGKILLSGRPAQIHTPRDAIQAGVGMVYQHFMLVRRHTVLENVILGLRRYGLFLDYRRAGREIERNSREYGLEIDPAATVWDLSVGEQQRVEIVKMLLRQVKVLILDEPTAVLTPRETEGLFATIRTLAGRGAAIVFISHKLREVMAVSDRITILRRGENAGTIRREETGERDLARRMVGREVIEEIEREEPAAGEEVLSIRDLRAFDNRRLPALRGLNLEVRRGEILGMAGISGNGQKELEEVLTGLREPARGSITLGGREIAGRRPDEIIAGGLGCVPEDRQGTGTAPGLGYRDNIILKSCRRPPIRRGLRLDYRAADRQADRLRREYDIKVPSLSAPVRLLSGGNLQKVILARELSARPRFLLAVHPTRGLDIGAATYVRKRLGELKRQGAAILLISEDLDELAGLSDRIAVIYEGKITGILPARDADRERLSLLMTGQKAENGIMETS
ncbi:MAG: ABC transporter ATP-binding protein [Candidatus Erginobacter occultus]|nr:ABC transporter ATP-binding protein [Candidatus Erginobacter occultus]